MKFKIIAATAFVTVATLGSANAADLPMPAPVYKAPPAAPVYNWTGCYVGAGGGYGMWDQDSYTFITATGVPATTNNTNGGKGWFGQGQVGCDYQFALPLGFWNPNLVVGAFGDFEGGSIRGQSTIVGGATGFENESSTWAAGGRAGFLVTPRFLTYFDGGYTQARFDGINYTAGIVGFPATIATAPAATYKGWFLGSGFEYAFDFLPIQGLFLKTEFRYSQYGNVNLGLSTPAGAPLGLSVSSTKAVQMISTELVWRFNWTP
jgi:outer membrane immunogenic protein